MLTRIARAAAAAFAALALFAVLPPAGAQDRAPPPLLVFAAASLKNALDDVNAAWRSDTGKTAIVSYAASSALAKQIEAGAPAHIFLSADLDWMDYLAERKLIAPEARVNLLGNRIVLIAPAASAAKIDLVKGMALAALLGSGRLAIANTDAVPAGKYGKAALKALGAWDSVKDKVAQAENVRAALLLVARGEAPLGIVYQTDAAVEPKVRILGAFPVGSHPSVVYPAAVLAGAKHGDAAAYFAFLRGAAARAVFEKYGFAVLNALAP